jgi:hypothetical protein
MKDAERWTKRLGVVFQCVINASYRENSLPELRHAGMLASNRLDTVGAMIEEMIRRASAQSAAAG